MGNEVRYLVKIRNSYIVRGFRSRKKAEECAKRITLEKKLRTDLYEDQGKPFFELLSSWFYMAEQGGRAYRE